MAEATHDSSVGLPESLEEIAQDFEAMSARDRLTMLAEFSDGLPDLPERYTGHLELLERVDECQSPLFLVVEVESTPTSATPQEATVHLFFQAPPRGSHDARVRGNPARGSGWAHRRRGARGARRCALPPWSG